MTFSIFSFNPLNLWSRFSCYYCFPEGELEAQRSHLPRIIWLINGSLSPELIFLAFLLLPLCWLVRHQLFHSLEQCLQNFVLAHTGNGNTGAACRLNGWGGSRWRPGLYPPPPPPVPTHCSAGWLIPHRIYRTPRVWKQWQNDVPLASPGKMKLSILNPSTNSGSLWNQDYFKMWESMACLLGTKPTGEFHSS